MLEEEKYHKKKSCSDVMLVVEKCKYANLQLILDESERKQS